MVLRFYFPVYVKTGEGKGADEGGEAWSVGLAPRSPLSFRKQLKRLQKVPLRPPPIL